MYIYLFVCLAHFEPIGKTKQFVCGCYNRKKEHLLAQHCILTHQMILDWENIYKKKEIHSIIRWAAVKRSISSRNVKTETMF